MGTIPGEPSILAHCTEVAAWPAPAACIIILPHMREEREKESNIVPLFRGDTQILPKEQINNLSFLMFLKVLNLPKWPVNKFQDSRVWHCQSHAMLNGTMT